MEKKLFCIAYATTTIEKAPCDGRRIRTAIEDIRRAAALVLDDVVSIAFPAQLEVSDEALKKCVDNEIMGNTGALLYWSQHCAFEILEEDNELLLDATKVAHIAVGGFSNGGWQDIFFDCDNLRCLKVPAVTFSKAVQFPCSQGTFKCHYYICAVGGEKGDRVTHEVLQQIQVVTRVQKDLHQLNFLQIRKAYVALLGTSSKCHEIDKCGSAKEATKQKKQSKSYAGLYRPNYKRRQPTPFVPQLSSGHTTPNAVKAAESMLDIGEHPFQSNPLELFGTGKRARVMISVAKLLPARLIRGVRDETVASMKHSYLRSEDHGGLHPTANILQGITDATMSYVLITDGQARAALYKQLADEGILSCDVEAAVNVVFVETEELEEARKHAETAEVSTIAEGPAIKIGATVLREALQRKRYSEADFLRTTKLAIVNNKNVPGDQLKNLFKTQGALHKLLIEEFDVEKNQARDMAAALMLPDDLFQKGLQMSDHLYEKAKMQNYEPATLCGYRCWQSISARKSENSVNKLKLLMDKFLEKDLAEIDISQWHEELLIEVPSGKSAPRQVERKRSAPMPVVRSEKEAIVGGDVENNGDAIEKDAVPNEEISITQAFINKINGAIEKRKEDETILVQISRGDNFKELYAHLSSIAEPRLLVLLRSIEQYFYIAENYNLDGKTIAIVTNRTGDIISPQASYMRVSPSVVIGEHTPANAWISEANGRELETKDDLGQFIVSKMKNCTVLSRR